ncbi:MAG: hypothetical protein V8Q30_10575 [Acutalibacteraceae bacterium]
MNPILMEDLLGYRFLSGITVSPFENRAVFTVAVQDARSNGYKKNLWQVDPFTGKTEKLTSHGKAGAFLFEKAGTLLCQKPGKKPGTTDYEYLEMDTGKTEPAFTLPLAVNKLEKLCDDLYLVNADIDTNYPEDMTEEERKAEEDYIKVGELPFWDNGVGYVSGHRDTLFLYNKKTGEKKRITGEKFALGNTAVSVDGKKVWYTGAEYTQMKLDKSGLYELDVLTGKVKELLPQDKMRIGQIKVRRRRAVCGCLLLRQDGRHREE